VNWNHRAQKILVTGKSGSGKTSFYLQILRDWRARWKFVFDPDREAAHKLRWTVAENVAQLNAAAASETPVCFDPHLDFPGDMPGAFAFFSRWALNVSREFDGRKLFAVDEIQKFTRPGRGGIPKSFQEVLDVGRREEIDLLIIAQRVNQVNDAIRGQLSEIVTFTHTDSLPLEWLAKDGFDPEVVAALPYPGGYVRRNVNTCEETIHEADAPRKGSAAPRRAR
jgi:hypothetical protein